MVWLGCCCRIGGVGSGRGPPGGGVRMAGGNDGRGGVGRVVTPPGPEGRARLPVAGGRARLPVGGGGGPAGRSGCGRSDSFGRRRGDAGRVGIAGTADVPGAEGSSILKRILGGTTRPGGGDGGEDGAGGCGGTTGSTGDAATAGGTSTGDATAAGGAAETGAAGAASGGSGTTAI